VLERSQFLDANVESAKMMTVLASLLAESGAHKRADTLLRQALELFWRELKDPTPAVARCYRVSCTLLLHVKLQLCDCTDLAEVHAYHGVPACLCWDRQKYPTAWVWMEGASRYCPAMRSLL
jgi:hypothetical protein